MKHWVTSIWKFNFSRHKNRFIFGHENHSFVAQYPWTKVVHSKSGCNSCRISTICTSHAFWPQDICPLFFTTILHRIIHKYLSKKWFLYNIGWCPFRPRSPVNCTNWYVGQSNVPCLVSERQTCSTGLLQFITVITGGQLLTGELILAIKNEQEKILDLTSPTDSSTRVVTSAV